MQKEPEDMVRKAADWYNFLFNAIDQGFCIIELVYDSNGLAVDYRFLEVNVIFEQQTGLKDVIGKTGSELTPGTEQYWIKDFERVVRTGEPVRVENYHDSTGRWYVAHAARIGDENSRQVAILFDDITEQKRDAIKMAGTEASMRERENWLKGQQQAFKTAISGGHLAESLEPLVATIAVQTKGDARSAFYLIPPDGKGLHLVAGMDEAYAEAINGFEVGPESLACGLAMHTGKPVITPDVEREPRWKPFLEIARKHQYRACWSFPVRTKGGPVLGTLAMYFKTPREPLESEMEMAEVLAHSAAIIISRNTELRERRRAEAALREAELQYRVQLESEVAERTAELKNSKELLQATLDSNPEMIQVFKAVRDRKGKITDFVWILNNASSEHAYGDVIGKSLLENNPGVLPAGIFDNFVQVTETGIPRQYEKRYVNEQFDGWFYQSVVKLDDGVATNTINITDRKKAEERLIQVEAGKKREIFLVSLSTLEEERYRISESLHNGIGQILYGIKINFSTLRQQIPVQEFNEIKAYINTLLTDAIMETRRVSHELMPATLEEFGLKSAIDDICDQLSDNTRFTCHVRGLDTRMEKYLELAVYRTVQELMTNVVRHASATIATIDIIQKQAEIRITVTDNGMGMEAGKKHKPGIGLASIRSKIKLLDGEIRIDSEKSRGTTVSITIPIHQ